MNFYEANGRLKPLQGLFHCSTLKKLLPGVGVDVKSLNQRSQECGTNRRYHILGSAVSSSLYLLFIGYLFFCSCAYEVVACAVIGTFSIFIGIIRQRRRRWRQNASAKLPNQQQIWPLFLIFYLTPTPPSSNLASFSDLGNCDEWVSVSRLKVNAYSSPFLRS